MTCPRCQTIGLREREREGLLVDVCPSCRGVWLDRGELEKLIARASRELDEPSYRSDDTPERGFRHDDDDDHDRHHGSRRKKRWSLADIFD